jgi:phosphocarrier protein
MHESVASEAKRVNSIGNPRPILHSLRAGMSSPRKEITRDLVVINKLGIHARPAAMFVKIASKFECDIFVEKDGERVNGKSIMGLMMLAAGPGSKLKVIASGADAAQAMNEIEALLKRKFDED